MDTVGEEEIAAAAAAAADEERLRTPIDDGPKDDRKEEPSQGGKCLLHVPARTPLDKDRMVSTSELFTKRIIDELVRFPNRRKQLMKRDGISKVSTLLRPIHEGDQYLIPESSSTWTQLLQLDWNKSVPESPHYYEEADLIINIKQK
jgi:hypothetical protein